MSNALNFEGIKDLGPVTGFSVKSTSVFYNIGLSGTSIPGGRWTPEIPEIPQGYVLWCRIIQITGIVGTTVYDNMTTFHMVAYQGIDGAQWYTATESVTAPPEGARANDYILHGALDDFAIANLPKTSSGDVCRILTLIPFEVEVVGNIRGPRGLQLTEMYIGDDRNGPDADPMNKFGNLYVRFT
jgi:hypothetical protein